MAFYVVINNDTREAVSFGSVLPDPFPENLTAVVLTDAEYETVVNGTGRWDAATETIVPIAVVVSTVQVDLVSLAERLAAARTLAEVRAAAEASLGNA